MSVQTSEFINRFMLINILKKWTATEQIDELQHKLKTEYYSQVNAYANRGRIMTERMSSLLVWLC